MDEVELVIFDMAGTTVEDCGEVPDAFVGALAEHGIRVTPEQLSAVRGSSKRQAVLDLIPAGPGRQSRAAAVYDSFRERLAIRYRSDGVRAVAGAVSTFRRLRERGVRVALNTGFDRETTVLLLDALGWDGRVVDAVVCGDDVSRGRPAPYLIFRAMEAAGACSVRGVVNVGDTVLDLRAGHNAGVRWNVGVLSGAHARAALEAAPHTHLLASVADLPGLWDAA
ncbi:MAG TPA: phosphonatase-like hydrolase [Pyrinomonadaceae bacterium]|jgi:phosphonatase-like hydrolase|nr:phosphonatase-like hydrolase [Pyrinomonadaceae bacterium]